MKEKELITELEKLKKELKEVSSSIVFLELEYMDIKERIIKITTILKK